MTIAAPYAKVLMQINGASSVSGGQVVAGGSTVQLLGESTSQWKDNLWEIYDYPTGFPLPSGWNNINGIYQSAAITPPVITLLTAVVGWGKYMFRLTVNGGFLNGAYHGTTDPQPLVYEGSAVHVKSPNLALSDIGLRETNQFNTSKLWLGEWRATLGRLDSALFQPNQLTVGMPGSTANYITNGSTDDVAINAAITAASAAGISIVRLLPGTYYISASITLLDGISLQGSGTHVTSLVPTTGFNNGQYYVIGTLGKETSASSGTTAGTAIPLTNDASFGQVTLTFAPTTETGLIAVGDFIMVQSAANWQPLNLDGNGRLCGEYAEVLAISNANGASTLSGALSSSATTVPVTDASTFTTAVPFNIRVEGETMTVTAIAGNNLTVTRGVQSQNGPAFQTIAVAHGLTTSLVGAITATATSILIAATTGFPIVPFRMKVESETIFVTAVSQSILTCVRGYDGTTAATHADTTPIVTTLPVNAAWIETSSTMRDAYYVSDSASFVRVTMVQNTAISDFQMYQQAARGTRTGNPPAMIGLIRARRSTIRNVYIHDNDGPGITIYQCLDVGVYGNSIERLVSDPTNSRLGYGCLIGGASERIVVQGNRFGQVRHGVDSGPAKSPSGNATNSHGIPRGVLVEGNVAMNTLNASFSTHSEADGWIFASNHASHANDAAFNMRAPRCRVLGNTAEFCQNGIVIGNALGVGFQGGSAAGSHVIGNTISSIKALPSTGGVGTGIVLQVTDHVQVRGNVISECDACGIEIRSGVVGCMIADNTITDCNLLNRNGSLSDGISIGGGKTAATSSLAFSSGIVTLTQAGIGSDPSYVGRTIYISGAFTPANNGAFVILSNPSATTVTYANASGATDGNNGAITYILENNTDNLFEHNLVRNNPASKYLRTGNGLMQSLIRDYGTTGQNERNIYRYNKGLGLTSGGTTNPIRINSNGPTYTAEQNEDGSNVRWSGNEKVTVRTFRGNLQTVDATVTVAYTFNAASLKATKLTGYVHSIDATGAIRSFHNISADFGNSAGTASQNAASPAVTEYASGAQACVVDTSGAAGRIRVTGIAATIIRWEYELTLTELVL